MADIAKVVNTSAVVNHAELVGNEDGTVQYDWAESFIRDKPFKVTTILFFQRTLLDVQ